MGHYIYTAAQEIQNDVEVGLCDGSSETGSSLASKAATASDSNSSAGLNPQPCAHLSTSASHEEAGEDSSTSGVGEPASLAKFDVLRFQNGFLEVRVVKYVAGSYYSVLFYDPVPYTQVVEELRMRRVSRSTYPIYLFILPAITWCIILCVRVYCLILSGY